MFVFLTSCFCVKFSARNLKKTQSSKGFFLSLEQNYQFIKCEIREFWCFRSWEKGGPFWKSLIQKSINVWIASWVGKITEVSGKSLLDAVSALGLTRYSEEDMILGQKKRWGAPLRFFDWKSGEGWVWKMHNAYWILRRWSGFTRLRALFNICDWGIFVWGVFVFLGP